VTDWFMKAVIAVHVGPFTNRVALLRQVGETEAPGLEQ
jgi:hypothetical protein